MGDVNTLLWILIFFVVFYLYIDIRITRLRKELLSHYMLCENMLSNKMKISQTYGGHEPIKLISAQNESFDTFTNIIPTREETARGFSSLNNMQGTTPNCEGTEWLSDASPVGSGFNPNGLSGYNLSDGGAYASFGSQL